MSRRTLALILTSVLLSLALASAARAQTNAPDAEAAEAELREGARLYRAGDFAAAEQHFRRALELNPTRKHIPLFIARAIQQQYKLGDTSPQNVATAERAIAAYEEILKEDRQDDDAYKAIVYLYGRLKRDDKVVEMLTRRAEDLRVPDDKRANAYVILASRKWQCSNDVTERPENKRTLRTRRGPSVRYRMPADASDFRRARRCADEGLRLIEEAVRLDRENVTCWSYKLHILREESKLAEMAGDAARKADYDGRYAEAYATYKKLLGRPDKSRPPHDPDTRARGTTRPRLVGSIRTTRPALPA